MRVAIIGGRLQGVEAAYLAQKAGWEVILFDRRQQAQASGLADRFYCMDVLACRDEVIAGLKGVDLIIPAIEDDGVLQALKSIANLTGIPLAFDFSAYSVSSSKLISNQLFSRLGVPRPQPWPQCQFPVCLKPSGRSGSEGVQILYTQEELAGKRTRNADEDWVIEEYLPGPSYSLEVIGFAGKYQVFQVTELEMDRVHDCKRVLAPGELNAKLLAEFAAVAVKLAGALSLNGIMDVETILHNRTLKVLEIDARLPSQTPTAVYHSSGINMVEWLGYSFLQKNLHVPIQKQQAEKCVIYEHCRVTPQQIEIAGEHILSEAGPLQLRAGFFGADEVLTDYVPGKREWVVTLIVKGVSFEEAWDRRDAILRRMQRAFNIPEISDLCPENELSQGGGRKHDPFMRERY
ncbi:3-methylornithine--L-lysine ligase PylC [Sporomusa acidovorans]|uniref:ATP-grasp domain-containing protein n=1 Tax=Sporomusa acidovorans (strain ATCC 49682 / DSM 3132 / Mol) TaxID=1123286 RepID=A0ABZ3J7I5_SPOA4|nr:3-methylornithine--L-lysine ligase PylC [Sporomusa acidovorans]OZC21250.1 carbamoyl-phosphate synthase large chain [Sporomusa acidovorans DSM 3132]SDE65940.1 pyrrolysine biosynthesis protein PylC [Sporomusa acidovorans]